MLKYTFFFFYNIKTIKFFTKEPRLYTFSVRASDFVFAVGAIFVSVAKRCPGYADSTIFTSERLRGTSGPETKRKIAFFVGTVAAIGSTVAHVKPGYTSTRCSTLKCTRCTTTSFSAAPSSIGSASGALTHAVQTTAVTICQLTLQVPDAAKTQRNRGQPGRVIYRIVVVVADLESFGFHWNG